MRRTVLICHLRTAFLASGLTTKSFQLRCGARPAQLAQRSSGRVPRLYRTVNNGADGLSQLFEIWFPPMCTGEQLACRRVIRQVSIDCANWNEMSNVFIQ